MKSRLVFLAVATIVSASAYALQSPDSNPAFRGVRVGSELTTLPFKCTETVFCSHLIEGDYIRVLTLNNRVLMFYVIYDGKTFDGGVIHNSDMTLIKALKIHSLAAGTRSPALRWARGDGGRTWGIVDIANHISYETIQQPSPAMLAIVGDFGVKQVTYLGADAPVLTESQNQGLGTAEETILTKAKAIVISAAATKVYSAEDIYRGTDRKDALKTLAEQKDVVDGKATMTLALMTRMSTWLTVDKDHPDAVRTATDLQKFYVEYSEEWRKLILIAKVNSDLFVNNEEARLLSESLDRNDLIKSKVRTLEAMGFSF